MNDKLSKTMRWIEHKGVRIIETDYRNLSGEDLAEAINSDVTQFDQMAQETGLQDQLQLLLLDGADFFTGGAMMSVKRAGKTLIPYLGAVAAVGSDRAATYALKLYGFLSRTNTEVFAEAFEAKEWLIKHTNGQKS